MPGNQQRVSVNYPTLANELQPGQSLLLADGMIELRIETVSPPEIHCRVILGGPLSDHKGISVPRGVLSSISAFTEQDRAHLLAGLEVGVDMAALSFVRSPHDIAAARDFLTAHHASLPLMPKIEKPEAVDGLDEILAAADSVMVARGDLGVEIPLAEVPLVQKDIIRAAVQAAKPVITATQMLRSMVDSPRPTRAEAADVANAVLDGTDAVMLSEESAVGAYPVEAVRILAQIAETAETRLFTQPQSGLTSSTPHINPETAIGHAACVLAREAGAAAIVCYTRTGRSAQLVAKHRPAIPIIAVSPSVQTVQRPGTKATR
jgi:pyruvate kinase